LIKSLTMGLKVVEFLADDPREANTKAVFFRYIRYSDDVMMMSVMLRPLVCAAGVFGEYGQTGFYYTVDQKLPLTILRGSPLLFTGIH